jgi:hypothetical protein
MVSVRVEGENGIGRSSRPIAKSAEAASNMDRAVPNPPLGLRFLVMVKRYWLPILITGASIGVFWRACLISDLNGESVSRSGSIITALGLVFALSRYRQLLTERAGSIAAIILNNAAAKGLPQSTPVVQDMLKSVQAVSQKKDKIIAFWETAVVIFGTMIWGFGDVMYHGWQINLSWSDWFGILWNLGILPSEDVGAGPG